MTKEEIRAELESSREALVQTRQSGKVTFFSRSKQHDGAVVLQRP
jgi:phosphoribosyl-AMP cyclohydrolase